MKLQSIQLLRSLAALLVAIVHGAGFERAILLENGSDERPLVNGLFLNGYGGVDLFFVISGFIMVWVTRAAQPSVGTSLSFLFARTTRIYPVWWFAAVLMTIYALLIQSNMAAIGMTTDEPAAYTLGYLVRSFLLIPQADYPILAVGWTLIHEIYFYAVFAVLLLLPRAFLPIGLLLWGGLVIAASFAMSLPATATNLLTLAVHPMTMEFILGALVGLFVIRGFTWRGGAITVIGAIWFTAALCLQGVADEFSMKWGRVFLFGFPCAALVYGAATLDKQGRIIWLLPALTGAVVTGMIFQFNPVGAEASYGERAHALLFPILGGALAVIVVVSVCFLAGRKLPVLTNKAGAALRNVHGALARTGDWSYSVYLTHLFAFGVVKWIFAWLANYAVLAPFFQVGHVGVWDNLLFLTVGLVAVMIGGFLTYHLVERPALSLATKARRALFSAEKSTRRAI